MAKAEVVHPEFLQALKDRIAALEADNARLRGQVKVLERAFGIYGTHKPECMVPMSDCSCGYVYALTPGGGRGRDGQKD
jgi:hypothetical protein